MWLYTLALLAGLYGGHFGQVLFVCKWSLGHVSLYVSEDDLQFCSVLLSFLLLSVFAVYSEISDIVDTPK
jgi:hypothetical protein